MESKKPLRKSKKIPNKLKEKPVDPVELHRMNCQTPGMMSHPPIPVETFECHLEILKANDDAKFVQEFEVRIIGTLPFQFNPLLY